MTCIVGYIKDGATWMGCDSQVTYGWTRATLPPTFGKLLAYDGLLIGSSGTGRLLDILRFGLAKPVGPLDARWVFVDFVSQLRTLAKDAGLLKVHDAQEQIESSEILIGLPGALYLITSAFNVMPVSRPYHAIGSGSEVAMGVLWQLESSKSKLSPAHRCRSALGAAADISVGVAAPFHFECVR